MKTRHGVAVLLALLLAGCLHPDPQPRFTPAWEEFDPTEGNWESNRKVLLISDCQLHNLMSKPLPDRDLGFKAAAGTAIRSPQLDLFADEVMEWLLKDASDDVEAVIHLGDAIDLSTEGEFELFVKTMSVGGRPWFMTPGNHDGYYFGSYSPSDMGQWEDAAYGSGAVLTKDLFIRVYVAALLNQKSSCVTAMRASLGISPESGETLLETGQRIPDDFEWHAPDGEPGFLSSICWHIDAERPWRSFILQSVSLQKPGSRSIPVRLLLLDSCQYGRRPELLPNAWESYPLALNCGLTGEMLPDQLRKARDWIDEGADSDIFIMACHHPFEALSARTKSSIGWLWRERPVNLMLTSHTHAGFFAHHDLGGESAELELNLGSTTDWPMEWRTLQAFVNYDEQRAYIQAERGTLVDSLSKREGYFLPGWEIPLDAPDDYRKYKQGEATAEIFFDFALVYYLVPRWFDPPRLNANKSARVAEEAIKNTLLWTYWRLLQNFPTDTARSGIQWPARCSEDRQVIDRIMALSGKEEALEEKVALLLELERFEDSRRTADPQTGESLDEVRFRYKICQAAWAARFEKEQGRRLRVEDDLIRIERKKVLGVKAVK